MALSPRQQRFIDEYLIDLNATQAAIRAGFSKRGAEVAGHRMLRNANVRAEIDKRQAKRADRVCITQDDVLRGLKKEAEFDGDGSSQSARVTAWKLLGDHTGVFKEKPSLDSIIDEIRREYGDQVADDVCQCLAASVQPGGNPTSSPAKK